MHAGSRVINSMGGVRFNWSALASGVIPISAAGMVKMRAAIASTAGIRFTVLAAPVFFTIVFRGVQVALGFLIGTTSRSDQTG